MGVPKSYEKFIPKTVLMLFLILFLLPCSAKAAEYIYYTQSYAPYQLKMADISNPADSKTIYTSGTGSPYSVAIDSKGGYIYFSDPNPTVAKIFRADLDGSNVTEIITGVHAQGIAVDSINGNIYYAEPDTGTVYKAKLGDSGGTIIYSSTGAPRAVAVDPAAGFIYIADYNLGQIVKAKLDGSNPTSFINVHAAGLALDAANGKIYYSVAYDPDFYVAKANLSDGKSQEIIYTSATGSPRALAVDTAGNTLYFSDWHSSVAKIFKANLTGSPNPTAFISSVNSYGLGIVNNPPIITSAVSNNFYVGLTNSFQVTATNNPTSFSCTGTLPTGVSFDTATGLLNGTPAAGTAGIYPIEFGAVNANGSSPLQSFTLTVSEVPVTGISIQNNPTKTVYEAGEQLDLNGLVVLLESNVSPRSVSFADFAANGIVADPANGTQLTTSNTSVTITHTASGKTVNVPITVRNVSSITVKTPPVKTTYTAGDALDLTGLVVTLNKSDSTAEDVAFVDFVTKGIAVAPVNGTLLTASNTTVTITYTADNKSVNQAITVNPVTYTISIGTLTGGNITASPATAIAGTPINLTVTPDAGKQLKVGSLKYTDSIDHAITGTSFTMPEANVTVSAEFEGIPPVITTGTITGTVTDGTKPILGAAVSLTVSGSVYQAITAVNGSYSIADIPAGTGYTVTAISPPYLPATVSGVTVTAGMLTSGVDFILNQIFLPPGLHSVTVSANPAPGGAVTGGGIYPEGAPITVTASVNSGYSFVNWTENGGVVSTSASYTFNLSTADRILVANLALIAPTITNADKVAADKAALNIGYTPDDNDTSVTKDLNLTVTGAVYGSTITWVSDNTNVISNSGIVTRPAYASGDAAVTVTATVYNAGASDKKTFNLVVLKLPQTTYTVTFNKNGGDTEASPATKAVVSGGNVGTLPTAPTRSGYTFSGWNTAANGSGTAFTPATAVNTSLTVYAQWTVIPSGGGSYGGGGSSSGNTATPTNPTTTVTTNTGTSSPSVTSTTTAEVKSDSEGKAVAEVTESQIKEAVSMAAEAAAKLGEGTAAKVVIKVTAPAEAKKVEASLPKAAVTAVADSKADELTVSTPVAYITFDKAAINTISKEATADVKINASKADATGLSEEAKAAIGDRPVFNFSVTSGDKNISRFGGIATVTVPYTPKNGEDTNAIVIYYINADGKPEPVSNCVYDPATGTVIFKTTHFSNYAIGYNKVIFKDVASDAWYGKAVGFVAARDITTGTGNGNYSPEEELTRAQFLVMVMRAYGISPDANPADNFADSGNAYYTGYLAAAKRLGITVGTGNNMFAPEEEITRQEMFTLLYNILKQLDELPTMAEGKTLESYSDSNEIAPWAKEAMALFVGTETISGNGGKLSPADTTNRAQIAQVLYNLLSK